MAKCVTSGSLKVLIQESITLPNKNEEICINEITNPRYYSNSKKS